LNRQGTTLDKYEEDIKIMKEKMNTLEKELKNANELNKKSSKKLIEID